MKKLYIVRHAKSSWSNASLGDFERPLNDRGSGDAPMMGKVLKKAKVLPDKIISSPAKRAIRTAELISEKIGYPKKKIEKDMDLYHAGAMNIIAIINKVSNSYNSLMIFGHNPGFTSFANLLNRTDIYNIPTAGIVASKLPVDTWKDVSFGIGNQVFFDYPKKSTE